MDIYEPGRKPRRNRARERYMVRQSKRSANEAPPSTREGSSIRLSGVNLPGISDEWKARAGIIARDAWWYATHLPHIRLGIVVAVLLLFIFFIGSYVAGGRIFPSVWSAGVYLGDKTVDEAAYALASAWENDTQIQLIDGTRSWSVKPIEIGLQINAGKTAEAARTVGMAGIPMGWTIEPVVTFNANIAQTFLLDMTAETDIPPFNAGYQWQGEQLVGMRGREGRMLDVAAVMEVLAADPARFAETRRIDLLMNPIPPDVADPDPFLEDAKAITSQAFKVLGYDPFKDETVSWPTNRELLTSWLEAGEYGLTLRDATFSPFLEAQNRTLNPQGNPTRYLDQIETKERLREALAERASSVTLRVRYYPTTYQVVGGDTGYRIARRNGIPYYLVEEANLGRDLGKLSIGDIVQLPSRDKTLPLDPVPTKRIVVNLDTQSMTAFENGQVKFNWLISSGMSDYPTYPGIFQILSHEEEALGSSFTLCNSGGSCGQWTMYWFMGMYEVGPGLMNGFHGAVLLPNGAYLGGGNVGSPYTFGCVMSQNDQAKLLYDWADIGTVVEVVSSEYPPQSPLGQLVYSPGSTMGV